MFPFPIPVQFPRPKGQFGAPAETEYYEVLKVPVTFSEQEVLRKSFRDLSKVHHPDKGGDTEKYQAIVNAYSILSDSEKRVCYDAYGKEFEKVQNLNGFLQNSRPEDLVFQIQLPLHECIKGKQFEHKYKIRNGSSTEPREAMIHVPPNAPHGHKIVMRGKGHIDPKKPLPGSLVIVVLEQRDGSEKCKRIGNMVLFQTSITLQKALTGLPIKVRLPDKSDIVIVQNIIRPSQWYHVKDTNFYIMFDVEFPDSVSDQQTLDFRKIFSCETVKSETGKPTTTLDPVSKSTMDERLQEQSEQQQQQAQPMPHVQECRQQ